jgi:hypothetical protein
MAPSLRAISPVVEALDLRTKGLSYAAIAHDLRCTPKYAQLRCIMTRRSASPITWRKFWKAARRHFAAPKLRQHSGRLNDRINTADNMNYKATIEAAGGHFISMQENTVYFWTEDESRVLSLYVWAVTPIDDVHGHQRSG